MTLRGWFAPLAYPVGGQPSPGGLALIPTVRHSLATHLLRPERRTRRRPKPGRSRVRAVRGPAASAGACARIRCAISQPIPAGSRLPDRPQAEENKGAYGYEAPRRAVGIGRTASPHLPEYADRPIPSPNCYANKWNPLAG
jgi:hypothetical protein